MKPVDQRRCPLAGAGARLLRKTFIKMCLDRYEQAKAERWQERHKIEFRPSCLACLIGKAVRGGKPFDPPGGVEFMELNDFLKEGPTVKHETRIPVGNWQIPAEIKIDELDASGLRKFWKTTPIPAGGKGKCPNCRRILISTKCYGLCGACANAASGKRGIELLRELAAKAKELKDKKKPAAEIERAADVSSLLSEEAQAAASTKETMATGPGSAALPDSSAVIDDVQVSGRNLAEEVPLASPPGPSPSFKDVRFSIVHEKMEELQTIIESLAAHNSGNNDVIRQVLEERERQDKKWGEQNHHPLKWLAIIQEELGEASKAVLDGASNYQEELIQVAASAVAAIECVKRGKWQQEV